MKSFRIVAAAAVLLGGLAGTLRGGDGVLYFTIGMHIEPLGTTAQGYRSSQADYRQPQLFRAHVEDIRTVARIVESHGARMTVQAQSPFTSAAAERGEPVLAELEASGRLDPPPPEMRAGALAYFRLGLNSNAGFPWRLGGRRRLEGHG